MIVTEILKGLVGLAAFVAICIGFWYGIAIFATFIYDLNARDFRSAAMSFLFTIFCIILVTVGIVVFAAVAVAKVDVKHTNVYCLIIDDSVDYSHCISKDVIEGQR